MIVNPDKFQAVIFDKRKANTYQIINTDQKKIKRFQKLIFKNGN